MHVKPFKPSWWLRNRHLQTMWSTLFRRIRFQKPAYRERVELPDGDFLDLDWNDEQHGPIILILHGLEGSAESPYAKGMLDALGQYGWRAAVIHFRGCSGEANRLPRTYHSADTADLAFIVATLKKREPETPIAAMGFSMGGNVLLKWLGETKGHNPLAAAIAVSVPFELDKSVAKLQMGFAKFYQWYLLRSLKRKVVAQFSRQPTTNALPSLKQIRNIQEFDDKVTAPLNGFGNATYYYQVASCKPYLKSIHVPTLLIQAKDDPFMPKSVIPKKRDISSFVRLEVSEKGGHVGFIGGKYPWRVQYWLEYRIPLFLKLYLPYRATFTSRQKLDLIK